MVGDATQKLVSILEPQAPVTSRGGAATLEAARAVGRVLGVELRAPPPPVASRAGVETHTEDYQAIARASHLRVRPVQLSAGWWHKDAGPLLAYCKEGHLPVALLPLGPGRYDCFDPTFGARTRVTGQNENQLERQAFMLYRSLPSGPVTTLGLFRFAFANRWRDLRRVLLLGVLIALMGMASIQAIGFIVDQAIPRGDRGLLAQIGFGLMAVALGMVVAEASRGILAIRLEAWTDHALQTAVWDRLLSLRVPFFRQESSGDTLTRVSAIAQIRGLLGGATLRTGLAGIFGLLNVALLWIYSGQLALLAIAFATVVTGVTLAASLLIWQDRADLLKGRGKILGLTVQLIQMVSKLRVSAAEERAFAYWLTRYSRQQRLVLRVQTMEDGVAIFNDFIGLVATMAVFSLTIGMAGASGETPVLTLGALLASLAAYGAFLGCARSLSNTVTHAFLIVNLWQRAQPILHAAVETSAVGLDPGRLRGRLRVERLSFRYRPEGPLVLNQVSLRAEPGEFVAVVGSSGSGKSTLVRLLLGFELPESGRVLMDDHELSNLDLQAVRRHFGVVLQNGRLQRASIYENLAHGTLLSRDDAEEAVRLAGLADFVAGLPMGMYTQVSEDGANLSGGQRQRLLLARALATKPRILILDEATSSLDNRTQAQIMANLQHLDITRFVIAHRLSTIRHADRIYVLEKGMNVQEGTYEELARAEGPFARFLARQRL